MNGRPATFDRVREIVAGVLDVSLESVTEDTSPENTSQWDSLRAISLVLALEQEFGVLLSTKEMVGMRSVGSVRELLRAKGVADA